MMTRDLQRHVSAYSAAADDGFLARTDRLDEMPYPVRVVAHLAERLPVHGHRFRVAREIGRDHFEARRRHDRHEVMPLQ
jgi:ribosomal protein L34